MKNWVDLELPEGVDNEAWIGRFEAAWIRGFEAIDQTREWHLSIPGEPVAKARPKLGTVNGRAMAFTPAKTRRYEDVIRQRATLNWNRPLLADVPVTLRATFFRGIPQSWPKKKRADALLGAVRPIGKPDLDNLIKSCTDALCGVVLLDDAIIVDAHAQKLYALEPRVEISLSW